MRVRTLALLGLLGWTSGCTAQTHSINDDTTTDTGGSESASGGGAATGGNANVGGTSFLDEGEILLGGCMSPRMNHCVEDLTRTEYEGTEYERTEEDAYLTCSNRYDDAFSEALWREHCPIEGAGLICKSGSVEMTYFYGGNTLTAKEAEESCQTGDGYGVAVYWNE